MKKVYIIFVILLLMSSCADIFFTEDLVPESFYKYDQVTMQFDSYILEEATNEPIIGNFIFTVDAINKNTIVVEGSVDYSLLDNPTNRDLFDDYRFEITVLWGDESSFSLGPFETDGWMTEGNYYREVYIPDENIEKIAFYEIKIYHFYESDPTVWKNPVEIEIFKDIYT